MLTWSRRFRPPKGSENGTKPASSRSLGHSSHLTSQRAHGSGSPQDLTVIHVDENVARVDGNHGPGKDLVFEMNVKKVEGRAWR